MSKNHKYEREVSNQSESLEEEEDNAVFVRADITKYDDPSKKRWASVKKMSGLEGTKMITHEIDFMMSKAHKLSLIDS